MHMVVCPRCRNSSYSTVADEQKLCAYCGTSIKLRGTERRFYSRVPVETFCDIILEDGKQPVKTFDISEGGVGIKILGRFCFAIDDMVAIRIEEFNVERDARVMWTNRHAGVSRAGLMYC